MSRDRQGGCFFSVVKNGVAIAVSGCGGGGGGG